MKMSIVNAKGRITIPAELRRKHGIVPGTKIRILTMGNPSSWYPSTKNISSNYAANSKAKVFWNRSCKTG